MTQSITIELNSGNTEITSMQKWNYTRSCAIEPHNDSNKIPFLTLNLSSSFPLLCTLGHQFIKILSFTKCNLNLINYGQKKRRKLVTNYNVNSNEQSREMCVVSNLCLLNRTRHSFIFDFNSWCHYLCKNIQIEVSQNQSLNFFYIIMKCIKNKAYLFQLQNHYSSESLPRIPQLQWLTKSNTNKC